MVQPLIGWDYPSSSPDEIVIPGLLEKEFTHDVDRYKEASLGYVSDAQYYSGEQYDEENDDLATAAGYTAAGKRMPEHLRKHAYSSHIQEAIDVLADMFSSGIKFDGPHSEMLNKWFKEHDIEARTDDWFREALITGQSFATPTYDPMTDMMDAEFWSANEIWPVYDEERDFKRLIRFYRFQTLDTPDGEKKLTHIYVQELLTDNQGDPVLVDDGDMVAMVYEVVRYTLDEERKIIAGPVGTRKRGFDLVHCKGDGRRQIRSMFGDSMITRKVKGTADRFNALGQLGFRVARQNSFATIGVVGDQALLGAGSRDESIAKDVADVLRFPGGTNVVPITLPTDPRMIESQQRLLEKNLYREFGLTKIDLDDIGGLGTVSGYALEVLNRKDRATHQRVRKNAIMAIRALANQMLDMHAYRVADASGVNWWDVSPLETYPNRGEIKIVIGSGDIVDAVGDRDDFEAGIVSRRYVLSRKGLGKTDIDTIEKEIASEYEAKLQLDTEYAVRETDHAADKQIEIVTAQAAAQPAPTPVQSGNTGASA